MESQLSSFAEQQAKRAESLSAFSGINLLHIKRHLALLLGLIGRERLFDQYTRHDIAHIDGMLETLEWLVTDTSKQAMSPADWLLLVLAIYLHDLGMLVTPSEYAARGSSGFPRFRDEVLFAGPDGADYRTRVLQLTPDDSERFLYQEFVRHIHAERIRAWIVGEQQQHLGISHEVVSEINKLLEPLTSQFRRDLGLICESHHLTDLDDLKKYKPSQPYGNSDDETANLQYVAVLLRTADLLHITSDRTPSVSFRVINPTDPVSQQEWAKQMAVTRVRPKLGLDVDGLPDEKAPKDTIEIHAFFSKENGFFGLTSFLSYAAEQLRKSHEWITTTLKMKQARHEFPWRRIDDSNIETEGFIRETFEFTIDQARILDLLTGHTLYNDTRVVLRELVQNAIDAVRVQHYPDQPGTEAKVSISWDSNERVLSVMDNGTGMTQEIITKYLLNVGTSRYQDPEFRKRYPRFSSISRFGIGVLSTFMVADKVEIVTNHPDEEKARHLTLRSVHGKYLIRLLDKADPAVAQLGPHGTVISLTLRPSAKMPSVIETAALWIVVPGCEVTVTVDGQEPKRIGFNTVADALVDTLTANGIKARRTDRTNSVPVGEEKGEVRVIGCESNGISLAYAVRWDEYFREWSFLTVPDRPSWTRSGLGTCIEGIRVQFDTPGYRGSHLLAIANVTGPHAPKTNVARSSLEATPDHDAMHREVYRMYCDHVRREIVALHSERAFSLTWAATEAQFLLSPLLSTDFDTVATVNEHLFREALSDLPMLVVESDGKRTLTTTRTLCDEREIWTIHCGLLRSAERLIRESATSTSAARILDALDLPEFVPSGRIVLAGAEHQTRISPYLLTNREVNQVIINREQRRVDLRWVEQLNPPRWITLPEKVVKETDAYGVVGSTGDQFYSSFGEHDVYTIGVHSIDIQPSSMFLGVRIGVRIFLFPGTDVSLFLRPHFEEVCQRPTSANIQRAIFLCHLFTRCFQQRISDARILIQSTMGAFAERNGRCEFSLDKHESKLVDLIGRTRWTVFDASVWERH